jgi:hypothetical protein
MGLLKSHEWRYFQDFGKGKSEAVCMPDMYMVHPDREELFKELGVTQDSNPDFIVEPGLETTTEGRGWQNQIARWGGDPDSLWDKVKQTVHLYRHYIPFMKV